MPLVEINKNPSPRELRWFGLLLVAFCGFVSGLVYAKFHWPVASWIPVAAGSVVAAIYYLVPSVRRAIYLGWMYAFLPLGMLTSLLLLAAIYFLVFTPIGLLMRLVGRERVPRRFDPQAQTYWVPRPPPRPPESYFRQF
ncbi:MAG: SxtJ family membrane protein [Deltaproteobacteria bacterium]